MNKFYPEGVGILFSDVMGEKMPFPVCEKCRTPLVVVNGRGYFSCTCHPDQLQICGHPLGAIAHDTEGKAYCASCAWNALPADERLKNLG
jgi:hypothetical protein